MPTKTTNTSAYVPGVCNINLEEIASRRRAGYLGASIFVVVLLICLTLTSLRWWRIILLAPAFLAAIGFLQARNRFCVGYGTSGMQNAEPGSTQAHTVTSEAALRKDKQRSNKMNLQALAFAVLATLITLAIPSLK